MNIPFHDYQSYLRIPHVENMPLEIYSYEILKYPLFDNHLASQYKKHF